MENAFTLCNMFPTVPSQNLCCQSVLFMNPSTSALNTLKTPQKLKFSKSRNGFWVKSSSASSTDVGGREDSMVKEHVNPIYSPTPSNRPTRTPHSG